MVKNERADDPAKAMELFYLSFDEFGPDRLQHIDFWVCICQVRKRVIREVAGGLSCVSSALLMELRKAMDGLRIQGPAGEALFVFCRLRGFLTDESAQQSIFLFKGLLYCVAPARDRLACEEY